MGTIHVQEQVSSVSDRGLLCLSDAPYSYLEPPKIIWGREQMRNIALTLIKMEKCQERKKPCSYLPSKRGSPRKKVNTQSNPESAESSASLVLDVEDRSSSNGLIIDRDRFHIKTPIELECILALLVLSVYEFVQGHDPLRIEISCRTNVGYSTGHIATLFGRQRRSVCRS
ncbi:hypothetical protein BDV59DRAFT_189773 [Aspergillus ambiguus]|uniref:uncharacterized protein n=1 Tax=Aspergillus ambiguus TaxID=176160 RepID=UPI003CCC933A